RDRRESADSRGQGPVLPSPVSGRSLGLEDGDNPRGGSRIPRRGLCRHGARGPGRGRRPGGVALVVLAEQWQGEGLGQCDVAEEPPGENRREEVSRSYPPSVASGWACDTSPCGRTWLRRLPMISAVWGTPSPRRHCQGGTRCGWLQSPRLAALASD